MTKKFRSQTDEFQTAQCHSSRPALTRRDFLARTAGASASLAFGPSILGLLSNAAYAGCSSSGAGAGKRLLPAFITVDLAGGGNLAGSNFIVGAKGPGGLGSQEAFLADYGSIGLTAASNPKLGNLTRSLNPGGLMFHSQSAFYEGLARELNPTARTKVDGAVFCARSGDDTQNNPHNPSYWVAKAQLQAGIRGELTSLVGSTQNIAGGNAMAPVRSVDPMLRPVQIRSAADAVNLVDVGLLPSWLDGGMASTSQLKARADRVMSTVNRMSSSQLDKFTQLDLPSQVRSLVDCGYLKSQESVKKYLGGGAAVDAAQDPKLAPIFGLNNTNTAQVAQGGSGRARTAGATQRLGQAAGIAKLVLGGLANAGTVSFGGYDYHNGARGATDEQDRNAGHVVGALINAAAALGQDLVIYLYTDGGLSSGATVQNSAIQIETAPGVFTATNVQKHQFTGDNGTKSMSALLWYRHAGLKMATKHQVGAYNESASVDRAATLISDNVENLTKAIVANYLSIGGKEGSLVQVVGDNPFGGGMSDVLTMQNFG